VIKATFLVFLLVMLAPFFLHGQNESELAEFQRFFDAKPQAALEKSLKAATLELEQAREIRDGRLEARALKTLGLVHLTRLHDYERAMDLFIRALTIEDSLKLESQQALTYVAISRVFEVVGDYGKSAQFLEHALRMNEAGRDINCLAMILIHLGKVNASMGKTDEALENYEAALRYSDDIDNRFEAEALFSLGQLNTQQGDYQEALANHKQALALRRLDGVKYSEAVSLNAIGNLYGIMGNSERSLANHLVALEIRGALSDKHGIAESYNNIGWLQQKHKEPEAAIASGRLALANGHEAQAQEQIFKGYELLSQAYKDQDDFKNALMYKELSWAIHEFILNEKQERQLLETQNRYLLEKKEAEIEKLDALRIDREEEIAAQKKFRNILFLLVGLMIVIALLVLYLYLVKRRSTRILEVAKNEVQQQNVRLQELNHTKDKFFSIISHDLKGPLNSLTSFSHLLIEHTDKMTREEIQLLAADLDKSVKNLYGLLENLLEWSRSQTGNFDFTGEWFDLTELVNNNRDLLEAQASNKNINIALEAPEKCPVKLHKQSINTVVRNLISNAIKFTGEGGAIRVRVEKTPDMVSVSVADNGVGMRPQEMDKLFRIDRKHSTRGTANEKGTGLGLILCAEFVEKNGGTITVKSEPGKGSVFTCSFLETQFSGVDTPVPEPASFS
jgi:signal transduction histidine kinase